MRSVAPECGMHMRHAHVNIFSADRLADRATMPSIEVSQCVCLLTLLWSLVEVHSQTSTPYITFRGQNLSNNSYVDFNQVGRAGDGSDSVRCHSELVLW